MAIFRTTAFLWVATLLHAPLGSLVWAGNPISSSASECQSLLRTPQQNAREIVDRIDRTLPGITLFNEFELNLLKDGVRTNIGTSYRIVRTHQGMLIGELEYKIMHDNPQRIQVSQATTAPEFRQNRHQKSRGVFKLLLAEAVLQHPKVTEISGNLNDGNLKVFSNAYRQLMRMEKNLKTEDTATEYLALLAVRQTPAYKARRALGFTEILEIKNGILVYLLMGIPTSQR